MSRMQKFCTAGLGMTNSMPRPSGNSGRFPSPRYIFSMELTTSAFTLTLPMVTQVKGLPYSDNSAGFSPAGQAAGRDQAPQHQDQEANVDQRFAVFHADKFHLCGFAKK